MKKKLNRDYLYGLHPVLESLKANRRKFYQLYLGQKIKNSSKENLGKAPHSKTSCW